MTRLVTVACHCVFLEGRTHPGAAETDSSRAGGFPGESRFYIEHARRGVELACEQKALLMFSGGATRREAGERTEAQSYLELARDHAWWGHDISAIPVATEDYARDSLENLWFSIARFRDIAGDWPEHVTAVGWRFKARRFGMHREAIGWPVRRFTYAGVNDPEALDAALEAEAALLREVLDDPLMKGSAFAAKREARNPFRRSPVYEVAAPAFLHASHGQMLRKCAYE